MKKKSVLLLLYVVSLSVVSYASDAVVERPVYSAGDYWIFVDGKGKSSKLEFLREEKDTYVFRRNGTEVVKDFSLMDVSKKTEGFPGPIIRFPLKKGNWWNYEFTAKPYTTRPGNYPIARYEAVDDDKITVPAGTFRAIKITVTIDVQRELKRSVQTVSSATYWYAPDVKQIIKAEKGEVQWELKKYKIK